MGEQTNGTHTKQILKLTSHRLKGWNTFNRAIQRVEILIAAAPFASLTDRSI